MMGIDGITIRVLGREITLRLWKDKLVYDAEEGGGRVFIRHQHRRLLPGARTVIYYPDNHPRLNNRSRNP